MCVVNYYQRLSTLFVSCTDCNCPKDVIPALKSLLNDLDEFCNQDKNTLKDIENSRQSALYGEFTDHSATSQQPDCSDHTETWP